MNKNLPVQNLDDYEIRSSMIQIMKSEGYDLDDGEVTITSESFADFLSATKSGAWIYENRFDKFSSKNDRSVLLFQGVQKSKGDQRKDLYIVDFGTKRAVAKV